MKRLQFFIAIWLVLTLASAGTVGISPLLHQLVEHGGRGALHTHWMVGGTMASPRHGHSHELNRSHPHPHPHLPLIEPKRVRAATPFTHNYSEFELPRIDLTRLWKCIARFLGKEAAPPSDLPAEGPRHEHHSLVQLVANGMIDGNDLAPIFSAPCGDRVPYDAPDAGRMPGHEWQAQSASRGPPVVGS